MDFSINLVVILSIITSFAVVALSIPSIIKVARAKNLYDYPDKRKSHNNTIPTLGGLAIFAGFVISVLVWTNFQNHPELKYVLAAIILMFFVGLKDDILVIAPNKKLIVQVVAALVLTVLGDIRFTNLQGFLGIHEIPYMVSILSSVFVIIVVLNGMNLIDGIDGLASGIGIVTSVAFGTWFYLNGFMDYTILLAALVGTLMAFFIYNVFGKENKIFMGDTGSLILGMVLSVVAIKFNELNLLLDKSTILYSAPSISIGVLIIPLFDTIRVFIIRIMRGRSPFEADRNHVHHRLLQLGYSHLRATITIVFVNLIFIATVFLLDGIGMLSMMLLIGVAATILSAIPIALIFMKRRKRSPLLLLKPSNMSYIRPLVEDYSDRFVASESKNKHKEAENYKLEEKKKVAVS